MVVARQNLLSLDHIAVLLRPLLTEVELNELLYAVAYRSMTESQRSRLWLNGEQGLARQPAA
jgi:hypothetical protein